MVVWIVLGIIVAVLTGAITLIWWKVGDQWANDEYKKFGHGGGGPKGPAPTVIGDLDGEASASKHESDAG